MPFPNNRYLQSSRLRSNSFHFHLHRLLRPRLAGHDMVVPGRSNTYPDPRRSKRCFYIFQLAGPYLPLLPPLPLPLPLPPIPFPFLHPPDLLKLTQHTKQGNYAVVQLAPIMIYSISWKTYFVFMCFNFAFIPIIYYTFVETKGYPLETLDSIFEEAYNKKENPVFTEMRLRKEGKQLDVIEREKGGSSRESEVGVVLSERGADDVDVERV